MMTSQSQVEEQEQRLLLEHKLFDASWYVKEYPDVEKLHIDPLTHYLHYGWKLGRNPSETFDTQKYIEQHPDVAQTNPLVHYLRNNLRSDAAQTTNTSSATDQPDASAQQPLSELERTQAQLNETQKLLETYFIRCQELETEIIKLQIQNRKTKKKLNLSRSQQPLIPLKTATQQAQQEVN